MPNNKNVVTILLSSVLFAALSTSVQAAKLYKWVDEDGTIHYEQSPPEVKKRSGEVSIVKPKAVVGSSEEQGETEKTQPAASHSTQPSTNTGTEPSRPQGTQQTDAKHSDPTAANQLPAATAPTTIQAASPDDERQQRAVECQALLHKRDLYEEKRPITDAEGNEVTISVEMREVKLMEINQQLDEKCR